MKIVVGLGNPGREYSATRHNVGFMTVDALAARWGLEDAWRGKFDALVAERRGGETILLMKPQTYMNLSGRAVGAAVNWYKLSPEDVIVVYDELDLPPGQIRLRAKGGAGGHRGVLSLLEHLGGDAFIRVRVGIGRPPEYLDAAASVLGKFSPAERAVIEPAISQAADAVEAILQDGIVKAANQFSK